MRIYKNNPCWLDIYIGKQTDNILQDRGLKALTKLNNFNSIIVLGSIRNLCMDSQGYQTLVLLDRSRHLAIAQFSIPVEYPKNVKKPKGEKPKGATLKLICIVFDL